MHRAEREGMLHERDVPRRVDAAAGHVVAPVAAMIGRVPEKHAGHGTRAELVCGRRGDVGVAETTEDAKLVVAGRYAEEQVVRRDRARGATGSAVDEEGCRIQCLCPERQWCCTVKQQSSDAVVNCT
jgi:hypothetical protein